jgi:hypothetical protein
LHPSCLVLKSAAGPCHAGPVRPAYRQVFWLLDRSTPGAFPGHPSPQWLQPVSSPITAAGPRRFCTVFPLTCKFFDSIPFPPGSQGPAPPAEHEGVDVRPQASPGRRQEKGPGARGSPLQFLTPRPSLWQCDFIRRPRPRPEGGKGSGGGVKYGLAKSIYELGSKSILGIFGVDSRGSCSPLLL